MSSGAISAFLKGTYAGDNDSVTDKLTKWLETLSIQATQFVEAPSFIETTTAKQIWGSLDFAKLLQKISIIHGASGVGKTKAAAVMSAAAAAINKPVDVTVHQIAAGGEIN